MNADLSGPLYWAVEIAFLAMLAAFALASLRLLLGPTLADRIVALDLLTLLMLGLIGLIVIRTGQPVFLDAAIALALVSFFATVAYARFLAVRSQSEAKGTDIRTTEKTDE